MVSEQQAIKNIKRGFYFFKTVTDNINNMFKI